MKSVTRGLQLLKLTIPVAVGLSLPLSALADNVTLSKGTDIVLSISIRIAERSRRPKMATE